MAQMLLLNPFQMTYQEVNVHTMNFIQDVNLDAPSSDAQGSSAQGGGLFGPGGGFIWIILVLAAMMLFMRPRQDKEGDKFRNALQKDQDVVTSSGIFGKVKDIDEVSVTLEIAQGMKIKVDKRYINPVPTPQPVKPEKPSRRKKQDPSKDEKAKA
jgi:preprotein translocase subunit YajC